MFDAFVEKHLRLYIAILFIGIISLIVLPFYGLYYFGNLNQEFTDIGFTRAKVTGVTIVETDDSSQSMHVSFITTDGTKFSKIVKKRNFVMKDNIVCLKQSLGEDETTRKFKQVDVENCQDIMPFVEPEPALVR